MWESEPDQPINNRSSKNIIKIKTLTLKGPAKNLINPSPEEVWALLFTPDMLEAIVSRTNIKLTSMRENTRFNDNSYRPADIYEIKDLLVLLFLSCIYKSAR